MTAVGPDRGTITVHVMPEGIAGRFANTLTIELARWSGEIAVAPDPAASTVDITLDMTSLRVLEGHGGTKKLTERDKPGIVATAAKVLHIGRHPRARFVSRTVSRNGDGGTIDGTLTLHGADRPVRLTVTSLGDGRYQATAAIVQSEYGIRPHTALFGALRVTDRVDVQVQVDLSQQGTRYLSA